MPTETANPPEELRSWLLEQWDRALPDQREMGERLLERYAERQRHYHDTDHLAAVLRRLEEFATDQDVYLVRLAAWFHDAVYAVPELQVTNEEASARLAIRELSRAGLEQEDLNQVARLVRLTATHSPGSRDPEGELLCDADLAVLAGSAEEYQEYSRAVRAEYAAVPEADYLEARLDILSALAETDIFRTGRGRALVEPARANVTAECRAIEQRLGELGLWPRELDEAQG